MRQSKAQIKRHHARVMQFGGGFQAIRSRGRGEKTGMPLQNRVELAGDPPARLIAVREKSERGVRVSCGLGSGLRPRILAVRRAGKNDEQTRERGPARNFEGGVFAEVEGHHLQYPLASSS